MILYRRTFCTVDTRGCEMHVTVCVSRDYRSITTAHDERIYVCQETRDQAKSLEELRKMVGARE